MKEGNTARFELELSHENIPVTWYKNDTKIHLSRTVITHAEGKKHVLEIKEVTLDDTCQIKAEAKGIPSMANLTVIGKTKTPIPLSSSSVSAFSPVMLFWHSLFTSVVFVQVHRAPPMCIYKTLITVFREIVSLLCISVSCHVSSAFYTLYVCFI